MITSTWKKSTRSGPNCDNCVEAREANGLIEIRDTKLGEASPVFSVSKSDWETFLGEIKQGITCPTGGVLDTWVEGAGMTMKSFDAQGVELNFTGDEWKAFVEGVKAAEFDLQPA